jgi:lipid-A-disaccharide synthase
MKTFQDSLEQTNKIGNYNKLNLYISLGELSGSNLLENCLPYIIENIVEKKYELVCWHGMGLAKSLPTLEMLKQESSLISHQVTSIAELDELAVQGYVSVVKNIQFFLKLWKKWKVLLDEAKELQDGGEDCKILLIDYPGFNLKIRKYAQKLGLKVIWLAPPQIWVWKSSRGKWLKDLDVGVLFKHELKSLRNCGAKTSLLGYPLFDFKGNAKIPYWNILENEESSKVLLVPGSREKVWKEQLPLWLKLCSKLEIEVKVWMSEAKQAELIKVMYPKLDVATSLVHSIRDAKCAICRPGTASLELALTGIPMVGFSILSFWKAKFYKLMIKDKRLLLANLLISEKGWEEVIFSNIESASIWLKEWYHSDQVNQKHLENLKKLRTHAFGVNKDLKSRWKSWLNKM